MTMRKLLLFALLALQPFAVLAQSATPISGLPAATTPLTGTEVVPIVQSGTTKKATAANIQQSGTQTANTVLAAPSGSSGTPSFRAITGTDISGTASYDVTPTFWLHWQGTENPGQNKTPSPLTVNYSYGYSGNANGTGIGIQSNVDVLDMSAPVSGTNEVAAYYGYVRANETGTGQPAGQNWWTTDFIIQSPYTTVLANRPNYIVGVSQHLFNLSSGADVIDSTHAGAFGLTVVANPLDSASLTASGVPTTASVYPVSALIQAAGFGGPNTVTSGEQAGALAAADYGVRVGGGGGSAYIGNTARSNFGTGIGVYDWVNAGIEIGSPLPSYAGPGLLNHQQSTLGGTALTGLTNAVFIPNNSGSYYTGVLMSVAGHQWLFGTDSAANSTDSFYLYAGSSGVYPIKFLPTLAIMGVALQNAPLTFATLPTCTAYQGTVAFITDASAAITAWHQVVTAGGGTNKALVYCNGTSWQAIG